MEGYVTAKSERNLAKSTHASHSGDLTLIYP